MKRNFFIGWLLLSLIFVGSAVALSSCSNDDDDLKGDVYKGYIENGGNESEYFYIDITHSPYKAGKFNELGEPMPCKKDWLRVKRTDFSNVEFKDRQKLLFRVISAETLPMLHYQSVSGWDCEIEIIKLY